MNVDIARLQKEIDDLSLISEATPPVVTRVLYSNADMKGRAFVKNLFREAGLIIREDAVGNTFARWEGTDKTAAPIGTGSHIDAIPNAGKYDGVVGVLGAVEAVRALKASGFQPQRSIDIIIFTAEEPTRFGIGCLGSRLLAGTISGDKVANLKDREGGTLDSLRQQAGFPTSNPFDVRLALNAYAAFVELHIEQGPILEARGLDIGIVEKIAAPSSLRMKLTGVGGHAGAVLMPERHDAGLAAAEISLGVEKAARTSGSPDTVGTTGVFRIEPGAVNSVPCFAYLEIDLRDTNVKTRDAALVQIETAAKEICQRRGVTLEIERVNVDAPAVCDPKLVSLVEDVCKKQNVTSMRMISRAYHDTLFMAQVAPTTMIFIPCL
ncbi:MAG: amidase, hydantoinase/carbamoylase family, partial [Verrucomicrobiales bacterium]|nr:amidase, hydantoinase/carbamoylase family [Verrucomicrobiales bacterium]